MTREEKIAALKARQQEGPTMGGVSSDEAARSRAISPEEVGKSPEMQMLAATKQLSGGAVGYEPSGADTPYKQAIEEEATAQFEREHPTISKGLKYGPSIIGGLAGLIGGAKVGARAGEGIVNYTAKKLGPSAEEMALQAQKEALSVPKTPTIPVPPRGTYPPPAEFSPRLRPEEQYKIQKLAPETLEGYIQGQSPDTAQMMQSNPELVNRMGDLSKNDEALQQFLRPQTRKAAWGPESMAERVSIPTEDELRSSIIESGDRFLNLGTKDVPPELLEKIKRLPVRQGMDVETASGFLGKADELRVPASYLPELTKMAIDSGDRHFFALLRQSYNPKEAEVADKLLMSTRYGKTLGKVTGQAEPSRTMYAERSTGLRQFADKHLGTNFEEQSKALKAAQTSEKLGKEYPGYVKEASTKQLDLETKLNMQAEKAVRDQTEVQQQQLLKDTAKYEADLVKAQAEKDAVEVAEISRKLEELENKRSSIKKGIIALGSGNYKNAIRHLSTTAMKAVGGMAGGAVGAGIGAGAGRAAGEALNIGVGNVVSSPTGKPIQAISRKEKIRLLQQKRGGQ